MIRVRQALLGDAVGISRLYCALVPQWTRRAEDGTAVQADYAELSLYERWQHGGPWLTVETCAVWLGHLLVGAEGIPIVAERDGEIVGQAEVFVSREAPPYGYHLNISTLCVHPDSQRQGVGTALINYIEQMAGALGCTQITAAYPNPAEFYDRLGFSRLVSRMRVRMPAEEGRVFYRAKEMTDDRPAQVGDWMMPLGRFQNSREEWERMYWMLWNGVPELVEARWHRLVIDLTGQPTILHLHQYDDDPSGVTARAWTKFPLSMHVVSAIKDRAARLGYEWIMTLVSVEDRALLPDATDDGILQWVYAKPLKL